MSFTQSDINNLTNLSKSFEAMIKKLESIAIENIDKSDVKNIQAVFDKEDPNEKIKLLQKKLDELKNANNI